LKRLVMKHKILLTEKHKICCNMINRFNEQDFIENQAKLDIFDMLERSLKQFANNPFSGLWDRRPKTSKFPQTASLSRTSR
jgi:hypothetical protein